MTIDFLRLFLIFAYLYLFNISVNKTETELLTKTVYGLFLQKSKISLVDTRTLKRFFFILTRKGRVRESVINETLVLNYRDNSQVRNERNTLRNLACFSRNMNFYEFLFIY